MYVGYWLRLYEWVGFILLLLIFCEKIWAVKDKKTEKNIWVRRQINQSIITIVAVITVIAMNTVVIVIWNGFLFYFLLDSDFFIELLEEFSIFISWFFRDSDLLFLIFNKWSIRSTHTFLSEFLYLFYSLLQREWSNTFRACSDNVFNYFLRFMLSLIILIIVILVILNEIK